MNSGNLSLKAGNSVTLNPGFEVDQGGESTISVVEEMAQAHEIQVVNFTNRLYPEPQLRPFLFGIMLKMLTHGNLRFNSSDGSTYSQMPEP